MIEKNEVELYYIEKLVCLIILCKYIFLFDDREICDSEDKFKDFNFEFSKMYFINGEVIGN